MGFPTAFWTALRRDLDGILGTDNAPRFWTSLEGMIKLASAVHFSTGKVGVTALTDNEEVLAFIVPEGSVMKVWAYGMAHDNASITPRLYNTTGTEVLVADMSAAGLQLHADDLDTPLVTIDATAEAQSCAIQASNAGAAEQPFALYMIATIE